MRLFLALNAYRNQPRDARAKSEKELSSSAIKVCASLPKSVGGNGRDYQPELIVNVLPIRKFYPLP